MKDFLIVGALLLAPIGSLVAATPISEVIDNVRRNETLYKDLDVTLHYDYHTARPAAQLAAGAQEITVIDARDHYVTQGDLFRLDRAATAVVGGQSARFDRIRAYDGATTRLLDQRMVANVIAGRSDDECAIRPHTLFFSNVIQAPLSTYLSGHDAMAAHPLGGKKWKDRLTVEVSYEGTAEQRGLRCHRVWITTSVRGSETGPYDRWELWLAEDRNYLPVEMRSWTFLYSKELPFSAGHVSDLREVAPGVWFPFDVQVVAYDPAVLQSSGRQVLNWQRRYAVETVSLDPRYERGYFHDVPFPDGTAVYEVHDRRVTRSYRLGTPGTATQPSTRARGIWLMAANISIIAAAILATIIVNRRRAATRKNRAASTEAAK